MDKELEVKILQDKISRFPGFADLYNKLGITYTHLGKYKEAKEAFNKALEINPNYVEAICNLAGVYIEEGDFSKSKVLLERAEKLDSNYHWLFFLKGQLALKEKKFSEAEEFFKKCIMQKPDFSPAYADLGLLYYEMGKNEEGEKYLLKSSLFKLPDEYEGRKKDFLGPVLSRKAKIAYKLGLIPLAEELFKKSIEANRKFPDLYNAFAEFLILIDKCEEAIKILKKALKLNPNYYKAKVNLAVAYIRKGNLTKGRKIITQLSSDKTNPELEELKEFLDYLKKIK